MWTVCKDYAESNCFKRFAKRHPREYAACFSNLSRAVTSLDSGMTLDQLASTRYFSSEGDGLFRIGQTRVPHAHETRLYVYIALLDGIIYVLSMGDKSSQRADINRCKSTILSIPKNEGSQQ